MFTNDQLSLIHSIPKSRTYNINSCVCNNTLKNPVVSVLVIPFDSLENHVMLYLPSIIVLVKLNQKLLLLLPTVWDCTLPFGNVTFATTKFIVLKSVMVTLQSIELLVVTFIGEQKGLVMFGGI